MIEEEAFAYRLLLNFNNFDTILLESVNVPIYLPVVYREPVDESKFLLALLRPFRRGRLY